MKKISRLMAMVILCLATVLLPTACGAKIEKAVVQPGTYATTVAKGTEYDVSNIVVEFTYSDDEKVTVTADELEFVKPDTSQVNNNAKLTIKYDGYSFDVTIRVVATEADVNSVSSLSSWSNNIYKENTTNNDPTSRTGFYNPTATTGEVVVAGDSEKYLGIEPRYVGTDNQFVLDLTAAGHDGAGELVTDIENVRTNIKVYLVEGTTETELTESTTTKLSDMVAIDTIGAKFKFTTAAHDKMFKLVVEPANKEVGSQAIMKVEAYVMVTNGFNVHNELELSVYDNSGRDYDWDGVADWDAIKNPILTAAGLPLDYVPSKILIQNDLSILREHVPSTMFWSNSNDKYEYDEFDPNTTRKLSTTFADAATKVGGVDENGNTIKLEGSMVDRDHTGVYHFNFDATNNNLELVGNYFTISAVAFPRAVVETRGDEAAEGKQDRFVNTENGKKSYMTSHSTLFCHTYNQRDGQGRLLNNDANVTQATSINWKNVNFTGNGTTTGEHQYSGSIILFKSYRVNSNVYNCVSNNFAINYFMSSGDNAVSKTMTGHANTGKFRVDYCKGYDAYQALLFAHGAKDMLVTNGEFIGSCGPAIISVFRDYEDYRLFLAQPEADRDWDEYDFYPTKLNVVNTTVESLITGKEPWFLVNAVGMDLEGLLAMLEGYLDGSFLGAQKAQLEYLLQAYQAANQVAATNKTIYNPEVTDSRVLNAKVATIMDGMSGEGKYYTLPALGYSRFFDDTEEYTAAEAYNAFYTNTPDAERGLQLDNHINQNLTANLAQQPLYMSDNQGSFIGTGTIEDTTHSYGIGPSDTNSFGNAIFALKTAGSDPAALMAAITAYQNAFHEDANEFYLYTPAGISCLIDLYDRP